MLVHAHVTPELTDEKGQCVLHFTLPRMLEMMGMFLMRI